MKSLELLKRTTFQSSCSETEQYKNFYNKFTSEFKKELKVLGCKEPKFNKSHFHISGFFKDRKDRIWYFSISDVRWSKSKMLIRTATSYTDFTGGMNQYITMEPEEFLNELQSIISRE
jgi:hypothetical protein